MKQPDESRRNRFYEQRDHRTNSYLERDFPGLKPVTIHADADACTTYRGQLLLVTLANLLARVQRVVRFSLSEPDIPLIVPQICGGPSIGAEIEGLLKRIDPYGSFEVDATDFAPAEISIGIGVECRPKLRWYLGVDRSNAVLAKDPRSLGEGVPADLRGAGLAAILGAATAFKEALGLETLPVVLSGWNFATGVDAESGPAELGVIDVGRGLIVGSGAVAASLVYWLMQWGSAGRWTIIDRDIVKLHNTNRSLLFFPDDAGWFGGTAVKKVECLGRYLGNANPISGWYDQSPASDALYDSVLVLANERNVRTLVARRNDPVQLHATTGRSWLSQLHRHIAGRDDCARCRMAEVKAPTFGCSEGAVGTTVEPDRPDAALPFLSAASGFMLTSLLQQLQLGTIGDTACNTWRWDFKAPERMASKGRHSCRADCAIRLPVGVRRKIAESTRWRGQPWLP